MAKVNTSNIATGVLATLFAKTGNKTKCEKKGTINVRSSKCVAFSGVPVIMLVLLSYGLR